ncbi:unnamed protein product, partial [Phaeothamnion confervicola]
RTLDLSHCDIDDTEATLVAAAGVFERAEAVNLSANRISDAGAAALAAGLARAHRPPRHIDLRYNHVSMSGVRCISEALESRT